MSPEDCSGHHSHHFHPLEVLCYPQKYHHDHDSTPIDDVNLHTMVLDTYDIFSSSKSQLQLQYNGEKG